MPVATVPPIQHVADHKDRNDDLIPLVHKVRVGRRGVFRVLGQLGQDAEDKLWQAYMDRMFPLATGKLLDFWGFLAGVPRHGLPDLWYRKLIVTAFRAKRSTGTIEEVLRLWHAATEPSVVEFDQYPHLLIVLTALRADWMPEDYAARAGEVVRRGCPIGATVLLEAKTPFLADTERDRIPYGDPDGTGAKVW